MLSNVQLSLFSSGSMPRDLGIKTIPQFTEKAAITCSIMKLLFPILVLQIDNLASKNNALVLILNVKKIEWKDKKHFIDFCIYIKQPYFGTFMGTFNSSILNVYLYIY